MGLIWFDILYARWDTLKHWDSERLRTIGRTWRRVLWTWCSAPWSVSVVWKPRDTTDWVELSPWLEFQLRPRVRLFTMKAESSRVAINLKMRRVTFPLRQCWVSTCWLFLNVALSRRWLTNCVGVPPVQASYLSRLSQEFLTANLNILCRAEMWRKLIRNDFETCSCGNLILGRCFHCYLKKFFL